jgi:hypothetical protein
MDSPHLSTHAAARYLGIEARNPGKAFRQRARRNGIPMSRIGRLIVVRRKDLDDYLRRNRVA